MRRFIFILCLLLLSGISVSRGAQKSYSQLIPEAGILLLQPEDSGTPQQDASFGQDLNEDENEMMLSLLWFHFISPLAFSYSHEFSPAFAAVEIIPRPPKA